MTEQELERLSALLDEQLEPQDTTHKIGQLLKKQSVYQHWYRYHLIGDAIRQELGPAVNPQLAAQVSKRLEQEPVVLAPTALKQADTNRWFKPAAGIAIAASVALMVVAFAPQLINAPSSIPTTDLAKATQTTKPILYVAEDGTRWDLLQKPKVESRLNNYLVNHQELAPVSNMKGIMPYASFVSYDGGN
jgi:sigma-E factor negative regulatory protein RseA